MQTNLPLTLPSITDGTVENSTAFGGIREQFQKPAIIIAQ